MAIEAANKCLYPQDFEAAFNALEQDLGDRFAAALDSLKSVENDPVLADLEAAVAEGVAALNQLMANGDSTSTLKNVDDLSREFGFLPANATTLEREKYLGQLGMVVLNEVLYIGVEDPNFKNLRRLFLSNDRTISKTQAQLKETKVVFNASRLEYSVFPPKDGKAQTISEIKKTYNIKYFDEDTYTVLDDNSVLILTQVFLGENKSILRLAKDNNLPAGRIVTSVFHSISVDNSVAAIERYQNLGYQGQELSAILLGQDLSTLSSNPLGDALSANYAIAASLVQRIDFFLSRFKLQTAQAKSEFLTKIVSDINALIESHLSVIAKANFQVTVLQDKTVLDNLKKKHADDKIIDFLYNRPDVIGLNFSATDDEKLKKMLAVSRQGGPKSTKASNGFLNPQTTSQETAAYSSKSLSAMLAALIQAKIILTTKVLNEENLGKAKNYLVSFSSNQPFPKTSQQIAADAYYATTPLLTTEGTTAATPRKASILRGQPTAASASVCVLQTIDVLKSFDAEAKYAAIDQYSSVDFLSNFYTKEVIPAIQLFVAAVKNIFQQMMSSVKQLIDRAQSFILPLKQKLDAFLSQFGALSGNGEFGNSLLKCSINFNIGLSIGIIDSLLAIISNIGALAQQFLSGVLKFVADVLQKVICFPQNMLNAVLAKINTAIPSFCQLGPIPLPDKLEISLNDLYSLVDAYTIPFQYLSRDLVRGTIDIDLSGSRLQQFKGSAVCQDSQMDLFLNISKLNMFSTSLPNPIGDLFGKLLGEQTIVSRSFSVPLEPL